MWNVNRDLESFQEEVDLIREYGFRPIAVAQMMHEDTFVFETNEEALRAHLLLEQNLGLLQGWWYGQYEFEKTVTAYEKQMKVSVRIFWL